MKHDKVEGGIVLVKTEKAVFGYCGICSLYLEQPGEHRVSVRNKLALVLSCSVIRQGGDN